MRHMLTAHQCKMLPIKKLLEQRKDKVRKDMTTADIQYSKRNKPVQGKISPFERCYTFLVSCVVHSSIGGVHFKY